MLSNTFATRTTPSYESTSCYRYIRLMDRRRIRRARASAPDAARELRKTSGIFSDRVGWKADSARKSLRLESGRDAYLREGASIYKREYPENELLHIWGADVWEGAWCSCPQCKKLSPQLQYMKVVNAIAATQQSADAADSSRISRLSRYDRSRSANCVRCRTCRSNGLRASDATFMRSMTPRAR